MTRIITLRVIVDGVVQGVGYREWTLKEAGALGLAGWVRNRRDGTIEAVFRGASAQVDQMLQRLRQGPRDAQVTGVSAEPWREAVQDGFEILPTV